MKLNNTNTLTILKNKLPKDRLGRLDYLVGVVCLLTIYATMVFMVFLVEESGIVPSFGLHLLTFSVVTVTALILLFHITIRRLHDMESNGLWSITLFIPWSNILTILTLLFVSGTKGNNKFGQPVRWFPRVHKIFLGGQRIETVPLSKWSRATRKARMYQWNYRIKNEETTTIGKLVGVYRLPEEWVKFASRKRDFQTHAQRGIDVPKYFSLATPEEMGVCTFYIDTTSESIPRPSFYDRDPNVVKGRPGVYEGTFINLVSESSEYDSRGLLVWLPKLKKFGTYDGEHKTLKVFPRAEAKDIISNIGLYLHAGWNERVLGEGGCMHVYQYCKPWEQFTFIPEK